MAFEFSGLFQFMAFFLVGTMSILNITLLCVTLLSKLTAYESGGIFFPDFYTGDFKSFKEKQYWMILIMLQYESQIPIYLLYTYMYTVSMFKIWSKCSPLESMYM